MKAAIMQPYFFPYIGYFQLIHAVDHFVLYDDVTFIKGGWINRNRILSENHNDSQLFGISLIGASSNRLIKDILFVKKDWKRLLGSLHQNYRKAPYFEMVYNLIKIISENNEAETITELNLFIFKVICEYCTITTPIYRSSELNIYNDNRVGRLADICKHFDCEEYVNAAGGEKLYTAREFKEQDIELRLIETMSPAKLYKQYGGGTVPNLSIIDVLMFNSISEIRSLMNCYYLRQLWN